MPASFPCLPSYFNLTLIDTIENWQSEFLQLMGQVYPEKKREEEDDIQKETLAANISIVETGVPRCFHKKRRGSQRAFIIYTVVPFASPLDPPAPPLTVTGSVGSGFPIGSGDSSMLLFEAFFESVVLPSGFPLMM